MGIRMIVLVGFAIALDAPIGTAAAAVRSDYSFANTAQACQLSIPTIDSKVRPRATSYNNEGTSNVYVICGYSNPAAASGSLTYISLGVSALNGIANRITCTAVNGLAGNSPQTYVSRTLTVPASSTLFVPWYPEDFGGSTTIPYSYAMSVTCLLPPQVGLTFTRTDYQIEIGS